MNIYWVKKNVNLVKKSMVTSTLLLLSASANATPIFSFDALHTTTNIGDSVTVDLIVSLGDLEALGNYDLSIDFDPTMVNVTNITFGSGLDIWGNGDNFTDSMIDNVLGRANVAEISNDFWWDLEDFQANSFTLASLSFHGLAAGETQLAYRDEILGDAHGLHFSGWATKYGSITVAQESISIPEPVSLILFGLAIVGLRYSRFAR